MGINRAEGTVKHMRHRAANMGYPANRQMNAIAGGVDLNRTRKGVRLSGFKPTAYVKTGDSALYNGNPKAGPWITFQIGSFVQADTSGDHRGIAAEETSTIMLDGATVAAGTELTLWGWLNDASVAGVNQDAFYAVTETDSPPSAHAVPLWHTEHGDVSGAYHWVPDGGASLIDLSERIDGIVAAGGTTRDFYQVAQNYLAANPDYQYMTYQDFGSVDGAFGTWRPYAGDEVKYDTDNRALELGVDFTKSAMFDPAAFSETSLVAARASWLIVRHVGGVPQPNPCTQGTVALVSAAGATLVQFSGVAEHDIEKTLAAPYSLASQFYVRLGLAVPSTDQFLRCIILLKVA